MRVIAERWKRERWCNKCDDYRLIVLRQWESSIAIVWDVECKVCHTVFARAHERKEVAKA